MFFKKFLFLFMSSLVTCWGIDTPEYKSNISAYPDLPEKLNILLDEEKKGLYDALIQKFKSLHEYPEHCTAVNIQENSWEEYYRLEALYATKFYQEFLSKIGPDFKELSDKFKGLHERAKRLNKTKPVAHRDLEKAHPESWEATKLFWEAAEKYYGQVNTTEHTNEAYGDLENAFLKTCEATKSFWGALEKFYGQVNTTEHTNEAHGNLKKKYPKSCESNILFGKAIEKFYDQVNTTEHTNEEKFYDQVNTTEHTNEEKFYDQVNTTEHTNEEKFCDQLNTTEHTNEDNRKLHLQQALKKFREQFTHGDFPETFWESLVDGMLFLEFLEKLELHLQESFEDYLEQWNTLKEVELMAIEAYKKYKNTEDDIQNFEEYKNVSQKLFHEIEYLVDLEGEFLYRTVQYEKGLSKEKRRETDLDYYKRVADYYSEILLV
uniref:Uncharacterized protein n=1 Tax=Schistosoma japonicum TaxID=6182 RepID=C1LQN6_SCHJA|nr:hypothetical protein [Schistosoma japonicum]